MVGDLTVNVGPTVGLLLAGRPRGWGHLTFWKSAKHGLYILYHAAIVDTRGIVVIINRINHHEVVKMTDTSIKVSNMNYS